MERNVIILLLGALVVTTTRAAQADAPAANVWPQAIILEQFDLYATKSASIKDYLEFDAADILPTLKQAEGLLEQLGTEPWQTPAMIDALATIHKNLVDDDTKIQYPGVTRDLLRDVDTQINAARAVLAVGQAAPVWTSRPFTRQVWLVNAKLGAFVPAELTWEDLLPLYVVMDYLEGVAAANTWLSAAALAGLSADSALLAERIGHLKNKEVAASYLSDLAGVSARMLAALNAAQLVPAGWAQAEVFWPLVDLLNETSGQFTAFKVRRNVLRPTYAAVIAVAQAMKAQPWSNQAAKDKIDFQCANLQTESDAMTTVEFSDRHRIVVTFAIEGFGAMADGQQ